MAWSPEITTDDQYQRALGRIDALMDLNPDADTADGRELIALVERVEEYEAIRFPFFNDPTTP